MLIAANNKITMKAHVLAAPLRELTTNGSASPLSSGLTQALQVRGAGALCLPQPLNAGFRV